MKQAIQKHSSSNTIYALGTIGAMFYFIGKATSLWTGVVGFIKALVWPAFLVYYALEHLLS